MSTRNSSKAPPSSSAFAAYVDFLARRRRSGAGDLGLHPRRFPERRAGCRSGQGRASSNSAPRSYRRAGRASRGTRRARRSSFRAGGEHDPGAQELRPALSALAEILDRRARRTSRIWSSSAGKASARPTCCISCATIPRIAETVTILSTRHPMPNSPGSTTHARSRSTRPGTRAGVCRFPKAWPMARPSSRRTTLRFPRPGKGSASISIHTTSIAWGREVLRLTNDVEARRAMERADPGRAAARRAGRTAPMRSRSRSAG